jgi:hypothetical protein
MQTWVNSTQNFPFAVGKGLYFDGTKGRLIGKRFGKAEYFTPRHFVLLDLPKPKQIAWTALVWIRSDNGHPTCR